MHNILTFDVEDWYQGMELPITHWASLEQRLAVGLEFISELLAECKIRATFFVLGVVAHEHPKWVRRLTQAGHEIGTHGWNHTPLYRQTSLQFRAELRCSIELLQDLTGRPVWGHRAAFFSLTPRTVWAIEELATAQVKYDSSLFPVLNYRYGWPGAPRWPHRWLANDIWEFPLSTLSLGKFNVPFSGGCYARFWPYPILRWAIRMINRYGQPAIVYFHPWEFDITQPRLGSPVPWLARATHYYKLDRTSSILRALLFDFEWTTMGSYRESLCSNVPC
jgi:polysaccharide deacetylase family protein (PEP-CTERM system associated)